MSLAAITGAPALAANPTHEKAIDTGRPAGKPQAPVEVTHELRGTLAVGEPVEMIVYITPLTAAESVSVDFDARGQLRVAEGAWRWEQDALGRETIAYPLTVVALSEGSHRILINVGLLAGGSLQSRIVSIPVQVGEIQPKQTPEYSGKLTTDAEGREVVSLPARGTVRPVEDERQTPGSER
jgi:hypothetical protein